MSKFSERFKELRQSRKLSQQELADKLNTSKSSVNMYERGEREPGIEMLETIADFFNVDMDYLLGKASIVNKTLANAENVIKLSGTDEHTNLTSSEEALLSNYRQLNPDGQKKVDDYVEDLVKGGLYPADDGEEVAVAARSFGKNEKPPEKLKLKKRPGAGSILDASDYKAD